MFSRLADLLESKDRGANHKQLSEGFSGWTVDDSDNASDLWYHCQEAMEKLEVGTVLDSPKLRLAAEAKALIPILKREMREKGNEYNTHGTLNVAMVALEHLKKHISMYHPLKSFIAEVASKLRQEAVKFKEKMGEEYIDQMQKFADKLDKLTV